MSDAFDTSLNLSQFSEEEQRELIQIFLEDGEDQLNTASAAIVQLEKTGQSKDLIDGLSRLARIYPLNNLRAEKRAHGFPQK